MAAKVTTLLDQVAVGIESGAIKLVKARCEPITKLGESTLLMQMELIFVEAIIGETTNEQPKAD